MRDHDSFKVIVDGGNRRRESIISSFTNNPMMDLDKFLWNVAEFEKNCIKHFPADARNVLHKLRLGLIDWKQLGTSDQLPITGMVFLKCVAAMKII